MSILKKKVERLIDKEHKRHALSAVAALSKLYDMIQDGDTESDLRHYISKIEDEYGRKGNYEGSRGVEDAKFELIEKPILALDIVFYTKELKTIVENSDCNNKKDILETLDETIAKLENEDMDFNSAYDSIHNLIRYEEVEDIKEKLEEIRSLIGKGL